EFTVIGDTVNTAARLEELTKENRENIIFPQLVYERLSPDFKALANELGSVKVKGKHDAVEIYGLPEQGAG
ncbi:MAG: adenylate/guanylate cyclase domain-containing protein, partial [bacterium]